MTIHKEQHELAGQKVIIKSGQFIGEEYRLEDWWDRIAGISWMDANGNPACLEYSVRAADERKPLDNNVVYGKIGMFGKLIHVSDLPAVEAN